MQTFWLGTHQPHWLSRIDVPFCVSDGTLRKRKSLPRAQGPVFIDSQGFTMLSMYGAYTYTPRSYVQRVRRYQAEIGQVAHASIMDWMVEPAVREMTGRSVAYHQAQTVESYCTLRDLAPDVPWVPVVQGWELGDYLTCVQLYDYVGFDLRTVPLVGVGSICRRQATREAATILTTLAGLDLRLHAFGVKAQGLRQSHRLLASADSMAWSFAGRVQYRPASKIGPPRCPHHTNPANCAACALEWRAQLLASLN